MSIGAESLRPSRSPLRRFLKLGIENPLDTNRLAGLDVEHEQDGGEVDVVGGAFVFVRRLVEHPVYR